MIKLDKFHSFLQKNILKVYFIHQKLNKSFCVITNTQSLFRFINYLVVK